MPINAPWGCRAISIGNFESLFVHRLFCLVERASFFECKGIYFQFILAFSFHFQFISCNYKTIALLIQSFKFELTSNNSV